jgi:hypothetical protein
MQLPAPSAFRAQQSTVIPLLLFLPIAGKMRGIPRADISSERAVPCKCEAPQTRGPSLHYPSLTG